MKQLASNARFNFFDGFHYFVKVLKSRGANYQKTDANRVDAIFKTEVKKRDPLFPGSIIICKSIELIISPWTSDLRVRPFVHPFLLKT